TINYKKNDVIFYTSLTPTDAALLADFAIYDYGAKISNVIFIGLTPGVPGGIADCSATAGNTEVGLAWTAPPNNRSPITEYEVQYGTVVGGNFNTIFTDDAVPGATITGLTNGTAYQFRVFAKNSLGTGPVSNVVNASPLQITSPTWTDTVGLTVDGNSITKNTATGWGNSGAASQESFTGDGGVEFVAAQVNKYLVGGLSSSNPDAGYTSIEYAILPYGNGSLHVYEKGVDKGSFGSYQVGDRFSVERAGSTIVYKKNDVIFYTSLTPTDAALLADFAIYDSGAKISNIIFIGLTPGVPGGIADCSATAGNTEVSLTWTAPPNNRSPITEYEVQYGTVASSNFGTISTDDAVPGATITGLTNGTAYQFRVVAKNSLGTGPVSNVVNSSPLQITSPTWTGTVGLTVDGNSITKNTATGWGNSGVASQESFTGDGGVGFEAAQVNKYLVGGLSSSNTDTGYKSIEYAILPYNNGSLHVYEKGVDKGSFGSYQIGDRFSVERVGSTIVYKKNDVIFYTSLTPTDAALLADFAIYSNGGKISNIRFIGITPAVPDAIADCSAVAVNTTVNLTWTAPVSNFSTITEYEVQYGTVAGGNFDTIFTDDAVSGAAITGLTNGTVYQFRVVAKNAVGSGPVSNVVTTGSFDVTGTWIISLTDNWVDPGNAGCPPLDDDTDFIVINQTENGITMVDSEGISYLPYVSGQTYTFTASKTESGTTITISMNFTLSTSTTGAGTYAWSVTDGTYTCNGGATISATKAQPGRLLWEFETGNAVYSCPAIGADGTIYVGSWYKFYAINPDGTEKWQFQTDNLQYIYSSPVIGADGTIYVGSNSRKLYAINPDGTKKWEFLTGSDVQSSAAIGTDGTIYVGSGDHKLYAINPDGTKKWEFITGLTVNSSPAIGADGTIYVGSGDRKLYAINSNGTKKWEFPTGDYILSSPAIGTDGMIYVGSTDHKLYAINPDGTKKWEFMTGHDVNSSPAIGADGTIYVGSADQKLYAINHDGTKKWEYMTRGRIYSSPAIGADGTIFVGSADQNLYAINPDGTKKWEFLTGYIGLSSPTISTNGTVYIGTQGSIDKIYAIHSDSSSLANSSWPKFHHNVKQTGNTQVNFSYTIDRFAQSSASSTFTDEFNDGDVAPGGPSGPSTYIVTIPFSSGAESGNLLNLNSNDAGTYTGVDDDFIGAALWDPGYDFDSGLGGSVEGKFRFTGEITKNTGFKVSISTYDYNGKPDFIEDVSLSIKQVSDKMTYAYFESSLNGEEAEISKFDVTDSLIGITDLTLRLDINSANRVASSLDFGSNGILDKTMDGSHDLTFAAGSIYTGYFGAWKSLLSGLVCETPSGITIPANDPDGDYTVSWGASSTDGVTYVLEEATDSNFTVDLRTAYTGIDTSADITGRNQNQTYYYRVKATKSGYRGSAWKKGLNNCTISQSP
ncbi:MAG: PQQ-binding-like beta-propeller repeat protein, partial [Candidatus Scalindua sp.]|nr:PQQ-binding-like beta-propeller repeat protein [Candidatus Scalindua sp.]